MILHISFGPFHEPMKKKIKNFLLDIKYIQKVTFYLRPKFTKINNTFILQYNFRYCILSPYRNCRINDLILVLQLIVT